MSAILAAVLAATAYPYTCDANWWRGKQFEAAWPFPRMAPGVYADGYTCTKYPPLGWETTLWDTQLYVPRYGSCTLYDGPAKVCRPYNGRVRAWMAGRDRWVSYLLELPCGSPKPLVLPSRVNQRVHAKDFDNVAWDKTK